MHLAECMCAWMHLHCGLANEHFTTCDAYNTVNYVFVIACIVSVGDVYVILEAAGGRILLCKSFG